MTHSEFIPTCTLSGCGEWLGINGYIPEICVRGPQQSGRTTMAFNYLKDKHANDNIIVIGQSAIYKEINDRVSYCKPNELYKGLIETLPVQFRNKDSEPFVLVVDCDHSGFTLEDVICAMNTINVIKMVWIRLPSPPLKSNSLIFG